MKIARGKFREVNWFVYALTALFIVRFVYLSRGDDTVARVPSALVLPGTGIRRELWGGLETRGGLVTRPEPPVQRPPAPVDRGTLWVARRIPSCPTTNAGVRSRVQ